MDSQVAGAGTSPHQMHLVAQLFARMHNPPAVLPTKRKKGRQPFPLHTSATSSAPCQYPSPLASSSPFPNLWPCSWLGGTNACFQMNTYVAYNGLGQMLLLLLQLQWGNNGQQHHTRGKHTAFHLRMRLSAALSPSRLTSSLRSSCGCGKVARAHDTGTHLPPQVVQPVGRHQLLRPVFFPSPLHQLHHHPPFHTARN